MYKIALCQNILPTLKQNNSNGRGTTIHKLSEECVREEEGKMLTKNEKIICQPSHSVNVLMIYYWIHCGVESLWDRN